MPRKITLGSPGHGASSVVVELGPKPTRFRFKPYDRAVEDELTKIGEEIDEASDSPPAERVRIMASQLDVLLECADDETPDASAAELIVSEYEREGSQLTQLEVAKLCERVGKEGRPT